jgi:hypothetical protein
LIPVRDVLPDVALRPESCDWRALFVLCRLEIELWREAIIEPLAPVGCPSPLK